MKKQHCGVALFATLLFSGAALAQTSVETDTQRNVNQQERIEQGLQSGQLNAREAGQLERQQQHIDKMESRDLRNGRITLSEQQRLDAAQRRASQNIDADKHNAVVGNPEAVSSQRLQADVQRNVNQQQRIENGEQSGALTTHEAGRLERGQAHVDRKEANAAASGHVNAHEQARIQRTQNRQSRKVFRKKHNARSAG